MLVGALLAIVVLALVLLSRQVRALAGLVISQSRTIAAQGEALHALEAQSVALRRDHERAVGLLSQKIDALNVAVALLSKQIDALSTPPPPADADSDEDAATCVLERSTMISIAPPRRKP